MARPNSIYTIVPAKAMTIPASQNIIEAGMLAVSVIRVSGVLNMPVPTLHQYGASSRHSDYIPIIRFAMIQKTENQWSPLAR